MSYPVTPCCTYNLLVNPFSIAFLAIIAFSSGVKLSYEPLRHFLGFEALRTALTSLFADKMELDGTLPESSPSGSGRPSLLGSSSPFASLLKYLYNMTTRHLKSYTHVITRKARCFIGQLRSTLYHTLLIGHTHKFFAFFS